MIIQTQFLNYLLNTGDPSLLRNNSLDTSFFSDYPEEFKYIKSHLDTYGNLPDKYTFGAKFPQFDWLEVKETPRYLIDTLYEDKNKRTLAKTFNRVRELLMNDKTDEAMALYVNSQDEMTKATSIQATDIFRDTDIRYQTYLERSQDYNKYFLKTGFPEIDQALGGWDRYEELATVVARPGVGKSFTLFKMATAAVEQGLRVGVYSGEMTALKVGFRVDTLMSHLSNRAITHGDISVQNDYKQFLDHLPEKGNFFVITPNDLGHPATISDLRSFIESYNLEALFIDQHSLLEDERRAKNPVEKASNISKDLKNLQVQKRIPIIAVSQSNRAPGEETGTYDVSRIAQADRIGQDSTAVLYLEKKDDVLTIHIIKSRDAISGLKLKYAIDLDKGIFDFIPNEEDALNGAGCEELRNEYEYNSSTYGEAPF